MPLPKLSKESRANAIASLKRYFEENMPQPIGDLPAGLLLDFFLEEIGPLIYNRAIVDAQDCMQLRVTDLNGESSMPMSFNTGQKPTLNAENGFERLL